MKIFKSVYFKLMMVFLALMGVMFFSYLKQVGQPVLRIPNNRGIPELRTRGDQLVAWEMGHGFHVFDWNDPASGYQTLTTSGEPAILLDQDQTLFYQGGKGIALRSPDDRVRWIPVAGDSSNAMLSTNGSQDPIILTLETAGQSGIEYIFYRVDFEELLATEVLSLSGGNDFSIEKVVVPDSAKTIVCAGTKEKAGYIAAVDVSARRLLWEHSSPEETKFHSLCVLDDGRTVLAGSHEGAVLEMDAATGKVRKRLLLVDQPRANTNNRFISNMAVNSRSGLLAASCDPIVYIIDLDTFQVVKEISVSHKIVSGLAFSPDGKYLATSDLRASGEIQIHPVADDAE